MILHLLAIVGGTARAAAVDRAAALHLAPQGLQRLGDAVAGLLPAAIPVTDLGGAFTCDEGDAQPLTWSMDDIELDLGVEEVRLEPTDGHLGIVVAATLSAAPAELRVSGDCAVLTGLDETCTFALEPASLVVETGLSFGAAAEGVTVTADPLALALSPVSNPLSSCTLSDALATLLAQDEAALSSLLLDQIAPSLEGVETELAAAVQDALAALAVDSSFSVGSASLDLSLRPAEVVVDPGGVQVRLSLDLGGGGAPADCADVDAWPWVPTDADWPVLSDSSAPGSSLTYDLGLLLARDLVDRLLWEVWAAGGLCLDLGELSGLDLTTDFLAPFLDPAFAGLFPESAPLALAIVGGGPPVAVLASDPPPLSVAVEGLALDLAGELDGRAARVFQVAIDAEVGIDPGVTASEAAPVVTLDPIDLRFREVYNPFLPAGFSGGLEDLVSALLPSVLPDLGVTALPLTSGIGLEQVFYVPTPDDAWLGAYVLLDTSGVEPVEVTGCSGASLGCAADGGGGDPAADLDLESLLGCSADGCTADGCGADQGCSDAGCTAGAPLLPATGRALAALLALLLAGVRRRG